MLVGHCAVAFAGKRAQPSISLGLVMAGAVLADLIGFVLLLVGVEHWTFRPGVPGIRAVDLDSIAWSHGLLPDVLWAALFAGAYFLWKRQSREAWIVFAAVVSHWVLDAVAHRPDMPLAPGFGGRYGMGMWTSLPATLLVEGTMWVIVLILYVRASRARKWTGLYVFWAMIAFITLSWINNLVATPPSGSITMAAVASLTFFTLMVAWAYWMDRVRTPAAATEPR